MKFETATIGDFVAEGGMGDGLIESVFEPG